MPIAHERTIREAWRDFSKSKAFKRANEHVRWWGGPRRVQEKPCGAIVWRVNVLVKDTGEMASVVFETAPDGSHSLVGASGLPTPEICDEAKICVRGFGHAGSCSKFKEMV